MGEAAEKISLNNLAYWMLNSRDFDDDPRTVETLWGIKDRSMKNIRLDRRGRDVRFQVAFLIAKDCAVFDGETSTNDTFRGVNESLSRALERE